MAAPLKVRLAQAHGMNARHCHQALEEIKRLEKIVKNCAAAAEFYEKVCRSDPEERIAVGTDHIDWVIDACRDAQKAMS